MVQDKLLSEADALAIQTAAVTQKIPFVTQLVQSKKIPARKIAETSARAFGLPIFDLNSLNTDYVPTKTIDIKLMQSSRVMFL